MAAFMRLTIALISFFLVTHTSAMLQWINITASHTVLQPPSRNDAGLGYYDNKLVLFGGRGSSGRLNDTWIFDLATETWTEINTQVQPEARFSFVYGVSGSYFYVSTGEGQATSEGKVFYNDVWKFDFLSYKWTKLAPKEADSGPAPRYGAAGGIWGDLLYVSLGFAARRFGDTFSFNVKTNEWKQVGSDIGSYSGSGPHPRCLHSGALVTPHQLVILGGCLSGGKTGGPCPSSDTWSLDGRDGVWTQLDTCATPRMYSAMASLPGNASTRGLILYGGNEKTKQTLLVSESPADEVGFFDPDTNSWSLREVSGTIPSKRAHAAMATGVEGIYMFGGSSDSTLWLLKGDIDDARNTPDTDKCNRSFFNLITLHGIFMFLGWGLCLQLGAFIARYMRPLKPPLWFNIHRVVQVIGVLLSIGGFGCAVRSVMFGHFQFAHAILGIIIFILGLQQPVNAIFRPHIDEVKSRARFWWEIFHMNCGRLALILAIVNVTLGLYLGLATLAIRIIWYIYMLVLIVAYVLAEAWRIHRAKKHGEKIM